MNNATFFFERPKNETVLGYAPNSPEREALEKEVERQYNISIEMHMNDKSYIGYVLIFI